MNKSKFVALFLALLGLAASGPAAAQVSVYLGGSVSNAEARQDACSGATAFCDRSDTGYAGYAGFMFNPNWGVELGYRDLRKVVELQNLDGTSARWNTKLGEAVVVAALPFSQIGLGDSFTAYAKVGGYYAKTRLESDDPFHPEGESKNKQFTYGVGLRYNIVRHIALRAEYQRYNNVGGKEVGLRMDIDVLSGGLLIYF